MAEQKKAPLLKKEEDYVKALDGFFTKEDQVALLLDYDGTLAPLSEELSAMPKDTEINIKKLAANDKVFMVVFSGRDLAEIKNHLKFPNVTYAGNHGLEVEYPSGKKFKIEMPEELLKKHQELVNELKEKVVLHGAWVEDKKISVTYHYKGVNDKLKAKLIETAKGLIQGHGFQLIETPYALEGKPRVNWDKGEGAKMILEKHFEADWAKKLKIIYVGDDTTDEDAIKVLHGLGKTFRVSELPTLKTYANYQIKTVEEVGWLLKAIQSVYEVKKK
nr:trehalose-phosphate phosphatase B [Bactrocera oleae]